MKYVLLMTVVVTGIFVSCKKTNSFNARVLFYNASWSLPAVTAAWNEGVVPGGALAQGSSSGTADAPYVALPAGTNLVTIKSGSTELLNKNIYTAAAAGSSFIVFDTSAATAPARILQLSDDLSLPDTAQLKFRILHLVPYAALGVDTWLVNGVTDSIRLDTAGVFIGTTATADAVQTFDTKSFHGGSYTVKIKKTGTQLVYASSASYPFAVKGIYTIIFSGLPAGTGAAALKVSVLRHPPQ
jgi:hypothetical protein